MEKKLLFLVNPKAGRNKSREPLFDAVSVLCQAGYLVNVHETTAAGDAAATAAAQGADYDLVVAVGGDGTLNETVSGLMAAGAAAPAGLSPPGQHQ